MMPLIDIGFEATGFEAALRSLLLALAVWIALRLFRVRSVPAQKAAWTAVLVFSLLMPVVLPLAARLPAATIVLPIFARHIAVEPVAPADPSAAASSSTASAFAATDRVETPSSRSLIDEIDHSSSLAPDAPLPVSLRQSFSLLDAAVLLYFCIAGTLLFRLLYGIASTIRLWRAAEPVSLEAAHLAGGLPLRCSRTVFSPVTLGSGVVLPADYNEWPDEKLRIVLAHERAHIRHGDFYLQALAGLYAALIWFSPLGWWLKCKLSDLGEAISDHSGLEAAASSSSYAEILLEFAAAPRPTPIGVAMARSSNLSHRIERVLNPAAFRQAFASSRRTIVAAVLAPTVMLAVTALVRVEAASQAPSTESSSIASQAHPDFAAIVAPPLGAESDSASTSQSSVPLAPTGPDAAPKRPLESNPSNDSLRESMLSSASTLAGDISNAASSLNSQSAALRQDASGMASQVNSLTSAIPQLNKQITANSPNSDAAEPANRVGPIHIAVPEIHVDVPAIHVNVPAKHIDIPAIHVNVPDTKVDVPAQHIDIPAQHVDIPATKIDVPAEHIEIPAIKVDVPAIHIDVPAAADPAGGQSSYGPSSSRPSGGLYAMLGDFRQAMFHPGHRDAAIQAASSGAQATFDRTLTFNGKLDLSVATGSGSIHISRGAANQIHIHGTVKTNWDGDPAEVQRIAANPPIAQNGNIVCVGLRPGSESDCAGNGRESENHISISYEIEAPADTTLKASSGSGSIDDTGVGHDTKLSTGSGHIMATGIEGSFNTSAGSGDITIEDSGQGDAKATTGSGKIVLSGVHGALEAQTGSGGIKVTGTPSSAWRLHTGSGGVDLSTNNAPIDLDASTGSGSISTNQPVAERTKEDRHHLHAQLNGGGTQVRIETGSGSIHVE